MSPSEAEELEEIVISGPETQKPPLAKQVRRRSSERRMRSPRYKSKSAGLDGTDRPLLHANSEPSSRLEFFAVSNRLFQPHTAESRNLSDEGVDFLEEYSKKPSPTGTDEERRKRESWGNGLQADEHREARGSTPSPREGASRAPPGVKPLKIAGSPSRFSSKTSQSFDGLSDSDSLESAAHEAAKHEEHSENSGPGGANTSSTGLTARQLLGREEQQRSLQRGESMSSVRSGSLRSSLKGGKLRETGGGLRMPQVVSLADIRLDGGGPEGGAVPKEPRSVLNPTTSKDDSELPLPRVNQSYRDLSQPSRNVSWGNTSRRRLDADPVVDHKLAGDLFLGGGPGDKPSRVSHNSDGGGKKPPPKGGASEKHEHLGAESSDLQFDQEKGEVEAAEEEAHKLSWKNFWKHKVFWTRYAPTILTIVLFTLGIALSIWKRHFRVAYFGLWRWCLFLGSIQPIYWVSHLVVHLLVIAVESTLFTTKQVLFYTFGVRKPLARFLRACMVLPVFVGCFSSRANDGKGVYEAYRRMTQLLGCAILFFFANVLKTLLAKLMSTHFHKEAHFKKMQNALQKEFYIMALSQPRGEVSQVVHKLAEAGKQASDQGRSQAGGTAGVGVGEGASRAGSVAGSQSQAGAFSKLRRQLPRMKKITSLPDMVQAAEDARAKEGGDAHAGDSPDKAGRKSQEARPGPTLSRPSESLRSRATSPPATSPPGAFNRSFHRSSSKPMSSFLGRSSANSQAPSHISRSNTRRRDTDRGSQAVSRSGVSNSQMAKNSERTKGTGMRALLRTAAFKKGDDQGKSVTNLTTALEDVRDTQNTEKFSGDLAKKLYIAEKHIRKNKLKVTFADQLGSAAHSSEGAEGEVASKQEAKRLAFYLFWNVKPFFDRNYILQEDLAYFLPVHKAARAFEVLDMDQDGKVSLHDIRDAILQIYQERKDLAFTLKDTKTIVGKLETILGFIIHVLFIILYLTVFSVDVSKVWISFSSILVAFSFIFSKAISDLFLSVVFLFVVHPFDVGDGILINNDMHFVEEISLQNSVLKRWDGARVWYPNIVMLAAPVINIARSGCKWESFILYFDIGTPAEVFKVLNQEIEKHMEANQNELTGEFACCNFGCADPMKIKLGVYFEYSHCGVDLGRLNNARHALSTCICETLHRLGVQYSMPAFLGTHQPGGMPLSSALGAESSRPMTGSQAHTVVQQASLSQNTAANARSNALAAQFPASSEGPGQGNGVHPSFMPQFAPR